MASAITLPAPLKAFFARFPLITYPPILPPTKYAIKTPTIWILPPRNLDVDLLSADVECLKWQAYLALRGLTDVAVRWDIAVEGGLDGRLPNLHVPVASDGGEGQLLAAHMIPAWMDARVSDAGPLEGYKDQAALDESHAWVSLLEGHVHATLALSQPPPSTLFSLLDFGLNATVVPPEKLLCPPAAPLTGISSLFAPYGTRISWHTVELQYSESIASLSDRLGTDKWFLGSEAPTALDALAFAYLHNILHAENSIRIEVSRRVNLVTWERRVGSQVRAAFRPFSR